MGSFLHGLRRLARRCSRPGLSPLLTGVVSALFVFSFLRFFKPFGFNLLPQRLIDPLCAGYALITLLLVTANRSWLEPRVERLFAVSRRPGPAAVLCAVLWPAWVLATVTLANVLFTHWYFRRFHINPTGGADLTLVVGGSLVIGSLCVVFFVLVEQNRMLRRNLRTAEAANARLAAREPNRESGGAPALPVVLVAENGRDQVRCRLEQLVFLVSEENYVAVHYEADTLQRVLLRTTMARMDEQLLAFQPPLFRCHRRYIVNTARIRALSGNAQGFRLALRGTPLAIPVSRRYVAGFRAIADTLA